MRWGPLLAACGGLAALSLLLPSTPSFDPWGWLVWGREVVALDLDTTSGPSWKPLPVLVTVLLSPAGELAPDLWLVVARTGWLAGMMLAFVAAARLAGPWAGVVACVALVLTPGVEARWIRFFFQGDSEPLLVALCLGAVLRHLDGHRSGALVLGGLAALLRPEVWPFLGLYGLWLWRGDASQRVAVTAVVGAVGLLWFGGDWLGSGSLWTGADRAQVLGAEVDRLSLVWEAVSGLVILPVWLMAAGCVALALRSREQLVLWLAGGALAWMGLVGAMTVVLGFAALGRFLAPSAAVLCVLAGAGAVRVVRLVGERAGAWRAAGQAPRAQSSGGAQPRRGGRAGRRPAAVPRGLLARPRVVRAGVAVLLLAMAVPLALPRAEQLGPQVEEAAARDRLEDQLDLALRRAGGAQTLLRCGGLAADQAGLAINAQPALAWKLDVRLADVPRFLGPRPGVVFTRVGGNRERTLSFLSRPGVRPLARTEEWMVFAVDCRPG